MLRCPKTDRATALSDFVRDAPPGRGCRPAGDPGAARPRTVSTFSTQIYTRVESAQPEVPPTPKQTSAPETVRRGEQVCLGHERQGHRAQGSVEALQRLLGIRHARGAWSSLLSPLVKYVSGRMASGLFRPRRGVGSDLVRASSVSSTPSSASSWSARSSSRPTRSPASRARSSTSCGHLDWVPRSVRARGPRDREGQLQARAPSPAGADGRGGRLRARDQRSRSSRSRSCRSPTRRWPRSTSCGPVESDASGRPGVPAGHAAGPRRARSRPRRWTRRTSRTAWRTRSPGCPSARSSSWRSTTTRT